MHLTIITTGGQQAQKDRIDSLRGRTLRWTFADGPTAGTTYEHTFNDDGSIGYGGADKSAKRKFARTKAAK